MTGITERDPLPDIPSIGLTFPSSPLALSALAYTRKHTSPNVVNHCIRSAYFAVIVGKKHPGFAGKQLDMDQVVFSILMHDLGWATTKDLRSPDKRFEVDGADLARAWLLEHKKAHSADAAWDSRRVQLMWDAIALHTTPSIAMFKEPEVALTQMGITHDFFGPSHPAGLLTADEYAAVAALFPRKGWADEMTGIMCGLCRDKPDTTFDNFACQFGLLWGYDGKGVGKEEFKDKAEAALIAPRLVGGLRELEKLEQ